MSKEGEAAAAASETIISLDLETTGLSTVRDRIVEYALVRRSPNGTRVRLSGLVNPGLPIPEPAQRVHKISDAMVRDAPRFATVGRAILDFLTPGATLTGHNFWRYDLPLLQAELARAGLPTIDIKRYTIVDSLILFRKLEPHTLAKALAFYCPGTTTAAAPATAAALDAIPLTGTRLEAAAIRSRALHRAGADAEAALDVFLAQRARYAAEIGASNVAISGFCFGATRAPAPSPILTCAAHKKPKHE